LTVSNPITVNSGGVLQIGAGVSATLAAVTMSTNSNVNLAFQTAGGVGEFTTVSVQGALTMAGSLTVNVPVQPSAKVTLITATSISGFSNVAVSITGSATVGRRLLSSGTVAQEGTSITYTPSTGSGARAEFVFCLPLAFLAALCL